MVALNVSSLGVVNLSPLFMAVVTSIKGIAALKAIDSAVYSDSIVDVAMHGCNLEHHSTPHPMTSIIYPVRDLTESGSVPTLVP
jgi:hypothetical protein